MRAPWLGLLGLWAVLGTGCGTSAAARLRSAEQDNRLLTEEQQQLDRALQSVSRYTEGLRSPGKAGRSFSMYYTPAALEQLAAQLLPMRMPARSFDQRLLGEVVIERLSDVRFGPLNTLTCRAELRGDNIRYNGSVPKAYQAEVRKFQSGVAAGVVADLVVELSLGGDNTLMARAHASRTKLKANSSSQPEGMLRNAMNERVLRLPFVFELTLPSGGAPRGMVLTANHLVVTYAP
ncbi:hypothetical protein ATI61_105269 [Archangium gephyra]|uniref:Lipoprotein n=1 Tax=Archangium gephyra TaxID=48 RepID=A0AAC8QG53_9BACT|nr:hypothetical protein [Archangium gephyra]AKJ06759.1 Hypothetical protein AA314_08385 [Archangium gephyra]REG31942.1 hypothetical protein ATI61_105269 [Archangium gephyra]